MRPSKGFAFFALCGLLLSAPAPAAQPRIPAPAENFSTGISSADREQLVQEAEDRFRRLEQEGPRGAELQAAEAQSATLQRGRVQITVDWRNQFTGESGRAFALPQEDRFAFFYFTDPNNPEVFVKVLDFGSPNPFLVFYAGLSNFQYVVNFQLLCPGGPFVTFTNAAGSLTAGANNTTMTYCAPLAAALAVPQVTSLNGLTGAVNVQGGQNISVSSGGNNSLTVAVTGLPPVPTSLPPKGPAGGKLAGSYPNPDFAVPLVVSGGSLVLPPPAPSRPGMLTPSAAPQIFVNDALIQGNSTGLASGVSGQAAMTSGYLGTSLAGVLGLGLPAQVVGLSGVPGVGGVGDPGVAGVGQANGTGVLGQSETGKAVSGISGSGDGVYGSSSGTGVHGSGGKTGTGVLGESENQYGVWAKSTTYIAVEAESDYDAVHGVSTSGRGVVGYASAGHFGVFAQGNLGATGTKPFVEPHPTDPSKEIRFVALEGPEAGTYFRGSARTVGGFATIEVPEVFRLVSDEKGLTVVVTPVGELAMMACVKSSLDTIVIQSSKDVEFHYMVNGVRKAFRHFDPMHENEVFVPRSASDTSFTTGLPEESLRRLKANGILAEDGTLRMDTAGRLGWAKRWQEREARPPQEPEAPKQ